MGLTISPHSHIPVTNIPEYPPWEGNPPLRPSYKCLYNQGAPYISEFFNFKNVPYNLRGLSTRLRVSQGFWGTREHWKNIEGNKGTLANFWEQGNKIRKITVLKHSERVWEHGNIGQFWKGTREQGPPWETFKAGTPLFQYGMDA